LDTDPATAELYRTWSAWRAARFPDTVRLTTQSVYFFCDDISRSLMAFAHSLAGDGRRQAITQQLLKARLI
jgi:hypothetical protein